MKEVVERVEDKLSSILHWRSTNESRRRNESQSESQSEPQHESTDLARSHSTYHIQDVVQEIEPSSTSPPPSSSMSRPSSPSSLSLSSPHLLPSLTVSVSASDDPTTLLQTTVPIWLHTSAHDVLHGYTHDGGCHGYGHGHCGVDVGGVGVGVGGERRSKMDRQMDDEVKHIPSLSEVIPNTQQMMMVNHSRSLDPDHSQSDSHHHSPSYSDSHSDSHSRSPNSFKGMSDSHGMMRGSRAPYLHTHNLAHVTVPIMSTSMHTNTNTHTTANTAANPHTSGHDSAAAAATAGGDGNVKASDDPGQLLADSSTWKVMTESHSHHPQSVTQTETDGLLLMVPSSDHASACSNAPHRSFHA